MSRTRFAPISRALVCLLTPLTFGAGRDAGGNAPLPAEPVPAETLTAEPMLRSGAPDLAKENARLRGEVEMLKSRVSVLESRVRELEAGTPSAPKPAPRPTQPQVVPKAPRLVPGQPGRERPVPEGWQEREFNGMRYYIVPLKPGEAKPAAPATLAPQAPETQPAQR